MGKEKRMRRERQAEKQIYAYTPTKQSEKGKGGEIERGHGQICVSQKGAGYLSSVLSSLPAEAG